MLLLAISLNCVVALAQAEEPVRLYEGLGSFHRPVKTKVPEASRFVDQGFAFLYGFQYEVAAKSFKEAARLDPGLVLAHWGIAATNGNYINKTFVSEEENRAALEALREARRHRTRGTEVENGLVEATFLRFSEDPKADRVKLNEAYSAAMNVLWQKHSKDADIGALYAESILNLRPWRQWTLDGKAQPGTEEALATLQQVLRINRWHPQALHLWIHAIEGSQNPERGLAEADRLMDLQPGLLHMQHMPAHIYNRTGQWKKTIEANVKSAAVYRRLFYAQGKGLNYSHGRHMLVYAAAMRGQSELALQQLSQIFDGMEPVSAGSSDFYTAMKSMLLVRFGRWQEVLALPQPKETQPFALAMWLEARGVAYAAQKEPEKARSELVAFDKVKEKIWSGDDLKLIQIASHVLAGEVQVSEGKIDEAIGELRKAVALEDRLAYTEPPDWILPTRHTLGAILLDGKRYAEAVDVFRQDLRMHPHNGWALYGLYRALSGLGKAREAADAHAQFRKAWEDADFEISSSCMCLPATGKR
ncbi:MAG: hypothetical protein HONBIEJF_00787 [Fimbriimonadaceae bacterium]|nr:hypothetical protein [Fimbriimonadaceae bacterium]